jgi:alpha-L-fucosidase
MREWFDQAKLGVFVVWSPSAVPAFAPKRPIDFATEDDPEWVELWRRLPYAEMYQNTMHVPGSLTERYHAAHYGDLPYDAFVERFRDEMIPGWDPNPVADLAAASGARYVVNYTKYEDGFLPWPSAHPNPHKQGWQSERDVVGELAAAVRARDLRYGIAYSGGMDWTFGGLPMLTRQGQDDAMPQSEEYLSYALAHWRELIDRYEPDVLWNDYGLPEHAEVAPMLRYYRERVPHGVINDRFGGSPSHRHERDPEAPDWDFVTPEYSIEGTPDRKWEACRGLGASFGYNRQEKDADYMPATELIHTLVEIVSRGGNLLIGLAPTGSGDVPWPQAERLLALGWWLRVNGGAIYGTRPWVQQRGVTAEGIEVRYTASQDAVHAIVLGTPDDLGTPDAAVEIDVHLDEGTVVTLEGRSTPLKWTDTGAGTLIELQEPPGEQPAIGFRLSPAHEGGVRPTRV